MNFMKKSYLPTILIKKNGKLNTLDKGNWSAVNVLPKPGNRKIWRPIPGTDYSTDYNKTYSKTPQALLSIIYEACLIESHFTNKSGIMFYVPRGEALRRIIPQFYCVRGRSRVYYCGVYIETESRCTVLPPFYAPPLYAVPPNYAVFWPQIFHPKNFL